MRTMWAIRHKPTGFMLPNPKGHSGRGGGTGQALRIAEYLKIPIFDIALTVDQHRLCEFVENKT